MTGFEGKEIEHMLRGLLTLCALGLAMPASAAIVTYTLSLNEGVNGQCQANSFAIYATDSPNDNVGIRLYDLSLKTAAQGGPNITAFTNRSTGVRYYTTQDYIDYTVSTPNDLVGF